MFKETHTSGHEEKENLDIRSLFWEDQPPTEFDRLPVEIKPGFHSTNLQNGTLTKTKYTFREIRHKGITFYIAGRDDTLRTPYTESRALNLYLIKDGGYVELTIDVQENLNFESTKSTIVAERTVVRHDPERTLPAGIGRVFTFQADDYLQQLANNTGRMVLERVDRSPGHDGVELSGQEWDRMFITELKKRGYTKTSDNTFSKEYHPE